MFCQTFQISNYCKVRVNTNQTKVLKKLFDTNNKTVPFIFLVYRQMRIEISPESNQDIKKKKKFLKNGNELQYLQFLKTFINLILFGCCHVEVILYMLKRC